MNPSSDQNAMCEIRDFADFATAHIHDNNDSTADRNIKDCCKKDIGGKPKCSESEAFVVIHFYSHCEDICDVQFCASAKVPKLCTITHKILPCPNMTCRRRTSVLRTNTRVGVMRRQWWIRTNTLIIQNGLSIAGAPILKHRLWNTCRIKSRNTRGRNALSPNST